MTFIFPLATRSKFNLTVDRATREVSCLSEKGYITIKRMVCFPVVMVRFDQKGIELEVDVVVVIIWKCNKDFCALLE